MSEANVQITNITFIASHTSLMTLVNKKVAEGGFEGQIRRSLLIIVHQVRVRLLIGW